LNGEVRFRSEADLKAETHHCLLCPWNAVVNDFGSDVG
jgi:hypothetical protein